MIFHTVDTEFLSYLKISNENYEQLIQKAQQIFGYINDSELASLIMKMRVHNEQLIELIFQMESYSENIGLLPEIISQLEFLSSEINKKINFSSGEKND